MKASVIVCAYTMARLADTMAALDSVRRQPHRDRELLVVDHNPELWDVLHGMVDDEVRLLFNSGERGLSATRNLGFSCAAGEIVVFLDDDAVAAEDWLERLLEPYTDPRVVAVGGRTVPRWEGAAPLWFPDELYWLVGCHYRGYRQDYGPVERLAGGNNSFRRGLLETVGPFSTFLGKRGEKMMAGEETEYCLRIRSRLPGAIIIYQPTAVIQHKVAQDRQRPAYIFKRAYFAGISLAVIKKTFRLASASEQSYLKYLLLKSFPGRLISFRRPLIAVQQMGVLTGAVIATGLGYLRGWWPWR